MPVRHIILILFTLTAGASSPSFAQTISVSKEAFYQHVQKGLKGNSAFNEVNVKLPPGCTMQEMKVHAQYTFDGWKTFTDKIRRGQIWAVNTEYSAVGVQDLQYDVHFTCSPQAGNGDIIIEHWVARGPGDYFSQGTVNKGRNQAVEFSAQIPDNVDIGIINPTGRTERPIGEIRKTGGHLYAKWLNAGDWTKLTENSALPPLKISFMGITQEFTVRNGRAYYAFTGEGKYTSSLTASIEFKLELN